MGKIILTNIFLLCFIITNSQKNFIILKYFGDTDRPVPTILLVDSKETYSNESILLYEYGISNKDFQIIYWFIINSRLNKDRYCSLNDNKSIFSLQLYYESKQICFNIKELQDVLRLLHSLKILCWEFGMNHDTETGIEKNMIRLIGKEKYESLFGKTVKNSNPTTE